MRRTLVLTLIGVLCFSMFPFLHLEFYQCEARYRSTIQGSSTIVSGYISENITWTLSSSPYIVEGNIIVVPDVFLTIEPGVLIRFGSATSLVIDGDLISQGNSTFHIIFSSNATLPTIGDWGAIRIRGRGDISYSVVEYASTGITFEQATGSVIQSLIRLNGDGISSQRSNVLLDCVNATGNYRAISNHGDESQPPQYQMTVQNSSIRKNGQGINHSNGKLVVRNCTVSENNAGISATGFPTWTEIFNTEISNNTGSGMVGEGSGTYTSIYDSVLVNNTGTGANSWVISVYRSLVSRNNDGVIGAVVEISDSNITYNVMGGVRAQPHAINIIRSEIAHNDDFGIFLLNVWETKEIHYTNIYENAGYAITNDGSNEINATYNWWGTTNEASIEELIYDYYDDYNLGRVVYKPYLTQPYVQKLNTKTSFTLSPNPVDQGKRVTLAGNLTEMGSGKPLANTRVDVYVGETFAGYFVTNGSGWFEWSDYVWVLGIYQVRVTYSGNASYNPSNHTETLTVQMPSKLDTQLAFTLSPNPASPGVTVTLSGTLKDTVNNPVYPAQVKVEYSTNGGATWNSAWTLNTNSAGAFSITFNAPVAGTYLVRVSYAGSVAFNPSSYTQALTVQTGGKVNTQITFTLSPNPASPGVTVTLSGTLRDVNLNPIYPAQVKVEYSTNGGATWNSAWTLNTNSAGAFYKTFTAPGTGTYLVRVSYAGSASYNPSSRTETLKVQ